MAVNGLRSAPAIDSRRLRRFPRRVAALLGLTNRRGWLRPRALPRDDLAPNPLAPFFSTLLTGFLRIVTHRRIFTPPTPIGQALEFTRILRGQPNCLRVMPGERHWEIFVRLCEEAEARGNLVPDA